MPFLVCITAIELKQNIIKTTKDCKLFTAEINLKKNPKKGKQKQEFI